MRDDAACALVSNTLDQTRWARQLGPCPVPSEDRHVTLEWSAGRRQGSTMMSFRFHTAATPGEPGDRDGAGAAFALARLAVVAASLGLGWGMDASAGAPRREA